MVKKWNRREKELLEENDGIYLVEGRKEGDCLT